MTKANAAAAALVLALAACGGSEPGDNAAAQLEAAANQSDPAAEAVLEDAAEKLRDADDVNAAEANAAAQDALSEAGNAQLSTEADLR